MRIISLKKLATVGLTPENVRALGGDIDGKYAGFHELPTDILNRLALSPVLVLPPLEDFETKMRRLGPPLWAKIHKWALTFTGSYEVACVKLTMFRLEVPCGECRQHWTEITERTPFLKGMDLFTWLIDRHNEVNQTKRTPSPVISVEEARAIWQNSP